MPTIECLSVDSIQVPQSPVQSAPRRFDQQVIVVVHQHVGVYTNIKLFYRPLDQLQKLLPICVVAKKISRVNPYC
jgi:hypothetical protein